MEADELELLDKSVRHALVSAPDADDALDAIGWPDVLAAEPRDAVSVVFGALGDLNAVASSLDDVLLDALGVTTGSGAAVVLPAFGGWDPPGVVHRRCARGRRSGVRAQCPARHGRGSRARRRSGDRGRRDHRGDRTHGDRGHRPRGRDVTAPGGLGAGGRHRDPRAGCMGRRPARRPAGARHRARRRRARHAPSRPRPHAHPRAIRPSDRPVPGGAAPPGRGLRRARGGRRRGRGRVGRTRPDDGDARQVARRARRRGSPPPTASRCWPASGSPRSTRCTAT